MADNQSPAGNEGDPGRTDDPEASWQHAFAAAAAVAGLPEQAEALGPLVRLELRRNTHPELVSQAEPDAPLVDRRLPGGAFDRTRCLVQRVGEPAQCARLLALLLGSAALTGTQRRETERLALEAAHAVEPAWLRAATLTALLGRLEGEPKQMAVESALDAALAISGPMPVQVSPRQVSRRKAPPSQAKTPREPHVRRPRWEESARAEALRALAPELEGAPLARALAAARAIEAAESRGIALTALAGRFLGTEREAVLAEALEAALVIHFSPPYVVALQALAEELEGRLLEQALERVLAIEKEVWRAEALAALAPRLEGELLRRALDAARAFELQFWRAWTLAALAGKLEGPLLGQALDVALALTRPEPRMIALTALAPRLEGAQQEDVLVQALRAAFGAHYQREQTLHALGGQLAGEVRQRVLARTFDELPTIHDAGQRARAYQWWLAQRAAQVGERDPARALDMVLALEDDWQRAQLLKALAPRLEGPLPARAFHALLELASKPWWTEALCKAVERLEEPLLLEALAAARNLKDPASRAKLLGALAGQLAGSAREEALALGLEAVHSISPHYGSHARVEGLVALARGLDLEPQEHLLAQALALALASDSPRGRVLGLQSLVNVGALQWSTAILLDLVAAERQEWRGYTFSPQERLSSRGDFTGLPQSALETALETR